MKNVNEIVFPFVSTKICEINYFFNIPKEFLLSPHN
jgi:hypothetical protein